MSRMTKLKREQMDKQAVEAIAKRQGSKSKID